MASPSLAVRVSANIVELRRNLQEGIAQIETTKSAMSSMSNSFDGSRIIAQAGAVQAQIQSLGGASKLTGDEQARANSIVQDALAKYRALGKEAPPGMIALARETRTLHLVQKDAVASTNEINTAYKQFDGILQSLGINIGPYVKGIEDITNFLSGGIGKLGLFGGAAAAVATALASWELGKRIGEVTGWTEAIARGTAVLKGYGDVQQEEAMAAADAADAGLKYAANLKRQQESVEANIKATQEHSDELKRNWMITDGNADALQRLQQQLDASAEKKKKAAIATREAEHAAFFNTEATKAETAATTASTTALDARVESLKRIAEAAEAAKAANDAFMNAPTLNNRPSYTVTTDIPQLTGSALENVVSRFKQAGENDPMRALWRALDTLESMEGKYNPTDNASFFAMQRDMLLLRQLRMLLGGQERPPGYADGVRNAPGGMAIVGERGPELVRLPQGSDVIPNHQLGGSTTINLTLAMPAGASRRDGLAFGRAFVDGVRSKGIRLEARA